MAERHQSEGIKTLGAGGGSNPSLGANLNLVVMRILSYIWFAILSFKILAPFIWSLAVTSCSLGLLYSALSTQGKLQGFWTLVCVIFVVCLFNLNVVTWKEIWKK